MAIVSQAVMHSAPRLGYGEEPGCEARRSMLTFEAIFVGKVRLSNRRFLQMCSHYLIEPVACTPAAGWEKGQGENQVGLIRERFFTPCGSRTPKS